MTRTCSLGLVLALALALVATGCAGDAGDGYTPDECNVGLSFSPVAPVAGPMAVVYVTSTVSNADGVPTYAWRVRHAGSMIAHDEVPPGSQITFPALTPGPYEVTLDVSVPGVFCPSVTETINVTDGSGLTFGIRLHVTPPIGVDAPPIDRLLSIPFGAPYELGSVVLDPGTLLAGEVTSGGSGVPAYLKFMPLGMGEAIVEAYAGADGTFSARILNQPHTVIVIPTGNTLAPKRFTWQPGMTSFVVDAGTAITGTVRDPAGNGLANAKVQLTIDGVPTTLATTSGTGAFSVRGHPVGTPDVKVVMTPPAGSGLPRLEATGPFTVTSSVEIAYAANVAVRNLSGAVVRRNGTAVPNAKVTVVGALAAIGTVTAGATASATGYVRVAASSNASGVLPSTFALAANLSAVVEVPTAPGMPTDLAVSPFDLRGAVPATIDAPPQEAFQTAAASGTDALPGARVELVPTGALALAGASTLHLATDETGTLSASLAAGGHYDAHWFDPAGRAGSDVVADVTAATMPDSFELPGALVVSGTLSVTGHPNKLVGASVQALCTGCNGLDRTRPLAEVASDQLGYFELAVPERGPR